MRATISVVVMDDQEPIVVRLIPEGDVKEFWLQMGTREAIDLARRILKSVRDYKDKGF